MGETRTGLSDFFCIGDRQSELFEVLSSSMFLCLLFLTYKTKVENMT